jgi:hypothetical protein
MSETKLTSKEKGMRGDGCSRKKFKNSLTSMINNKNKLSGKTRPKKLKLCQSTLFLISSKLMTTITQFGGFRRAENGS